MAVRLTLAGMVFLASMAAAGEPAKPANKVEGEVVNAIVAIVNNEPVTQLEVTALVAEFYRSTPNMTTEEHEAAWTRAREALVEQQLLIQEARRLKVPVDAEEVNDEVARLKKMGVDAEGRRDLIRERIIVSVLLARLQSARAVSPADVADYYDKHRDDFVLRERRHVFVIGIYASSFGGDKGAAKLRANEVLARLKRGEDFATLAKKHSDGAFADKGGDYGWIEKGAMVGPLDAVASKLKPGEVSDLVETKDGYLIVRVDGVQPASRQSLAEARPKIQQRLLGKARQARRRRLIDRLKQSATILRLDFKPTPSATP